MGRLFLPLSVPRNSRVAEFGEGSLNLIRLDGSSAAYRYVKAVRPA